MSACVRPIAVRAGDGIVTRACGSHRRDRCPGCAALYRGDVFHLIAAGLRGGKGVPRGVRAHPMVFVTVTAPALGWPHRPDYLRAFAFNHSVGDLWRRTTIYAARALARRLGVSQRRLARMVRLSYVRVAEYQSRGLVHLHAVVRLDRAMPRYRRDQVRPPGYPFTDSMLAEALRETIATVTAPVARELGGYLPDERVSWGPGHDVHPVSDPESAATDIAGYATKDIDKRPGEGSSSYSDGPRGGSTASVASVGTRLADAEVDPQLSARLRRSAPRLGYRGHTMTKSRRFSTTLSALRAVRRAFASGGNAPSRIDQGETPPTPPPRRELGP